MLNTRQLQAVMWRTLCLFSLRYHDFSPMSRAARGLGPPQLGRYLGTELAIPFYLISFCEIFQVCV